MKTTKFQLKNKLDVYLIESRKSPVVSVQMWVNTGSVDEKKGEEGISHFIEHLVFKGTNEYQVGEIANSVESSGGELNAFTSFDQTVFYVTISTHFKEVALKVIREMMGYPKFDATEINNEREVVVEEIKRGKDSLGRVASQHLFSTVFKNSNYGKPVIGYEKNVRSWSAEKIKNYFSKRYSTQNMFLVVAGDFDPAEMKKQIKENFEGIKRTHFEKRKKQSKVSLPKKSTFSIENTKFEQSICYLAWRTPTITHKDFPALQLVSMMLGYGDTSRLVQELRMKVALVNSIGSSAYYTKEDGMFIVQAAYNKDKLSQILPKISDEIIKIKNEGFTEQELARAKVNLLSDEAFSLENVEALANKLGYDLSICKKSDFTKNYLKKIAKVTVKDLSAVIKKYIDLQKITVTVSTNDDLVKTEQTVKEWISELKNPTAKTKIKPSKKLKVKIPNFIIGNKTQEIETGVHPLGFKYVLRHSDESPVISARIAMLGGTRVESDQSCGTHELLARTWLGGTKDMDEFQLASEIESNAMKLMPNSGRSSLGLAVECLKTFEHGSAQLMSGVLSKSVFPQEIIDREKMVQLEHIKAKADQPAQISIMNFLKTLFPGSYLGRDSLGSAETLAKINRPMITDFLNKALKAENIVLSLSGPFNQKIWLDELAKEISGFQKGYQEISKTQFTEIKKDEKVFAESKKEQTHLVYGFKGLNMFDEDRYALHIIQSVLAGMGGRLFYELREKNSLAYSVSPLMLEGIENGYFAAYIGCSPDKTEKALQMMKAEFAKLVESEISQSELDRAKQYLIGSFDIDLQRSSAVGSILLYDLLYGLDPKRALDVTEKYQSITASDIRRVAERILTQKSCLSVVGPNMI
jgi:zinc protease